MRYKVTFEFDSEDEDRDVSQWYWPDLLSSVDDSTTTIDPDSIKVFRFAGWEEI